jgi:hypothetical protein
LRREAAILAAVAGPHVIGVRAVVVDGDDAVLVLDHAGGGSLATVLAVRGRIDAPEVVTVLAPLAAALAAAHARGLVHGDLTPANILFAADGRPMLADFGVAHAVGLAPAVVEGTVGYVAPEVIAGATVSTVSTASDVYALGAIGYAALAGQPPEPGAEGSTDGGIPVAAPAALVDAIESALATDPLDRPGAAALAAAVLESCAAGPVVLVGGGGTPEIPVTRAVRPVGGDAEGASVVVPERASPGPARRRLLVAVAAAAGLALAVGVGEVWGRQGHGAAAALPVAAGSPTPGTTAPAWTSIVQGLAATRAASFARADASLLAGVYAPGSSAYGTDLETVRSLADRGLRARGFAITVERVAVDRASDSAARLHVVDRLSGYTLVDASGAVQGRGSGSASRGFTMSLRRTRSGWRIAALTPS